MINLNSLSIRKVILKTLLDYSPLQREKLHDLNTSIYVAYLSS